RHHESVSGGAGFQRPENSDRSRNLEMPFVRMAMTSSGVDASSAALVAARASPAGTDRMIFFTSGSDDGATLSAVMSRPSSMKTPSGLLASSPHTLTSIPALRPVRPV